MATATFTVIFTGFISFMETFLTGVYNLTEVLIFGSVAFISSYFVAIFLKWLANKTNN